jgi:[ribosomal protein S5]-alanine N-acetyltransferase
MNASRISIRTENLILRDFTPDDFEAFFDTTCDPEYQKYYPEHETTRSFLQDVFTCLLASSDVTNRVIYQLGVCLHSGELIGTCGIRVENEDNRQASFGCAIARGYWGKAYAFEASLAIIGYAFSSLPVNRIYAETNGDNWRARKLAERLGMRQEALLKETKIFRGRWWDTAIYAILKEEWRQRWDAGTPGPIEISNSH